jgi:diacylglycerol kinase family enzyme
MRRRVAAIAAIVLAAAGLGLAIAIAVDEFPRGLIVLALTALALGAAWYGVLRRGIARIAGLSAAVLLFVAGLLFVLSSARVADLVVFALLAAAVGMARIAFHARVTLPPAMAPERPVLFFNPKSGGGKAEKFALADEARSRGIEPVELRRGDDLETLVRDAVGRGADALAMAGGDGSQAIVAAVAAERRLPYACIPAGTRNHFALDIGVDREDVVGALDAFVEGGERTIDLAEVNGRVFVNNVSLGLYAEAVQRPGYREAKLKTLLDTVPDALGPDREEPLDLRYIRADGGEPEPVLALLVSNNNYRLGRLLGAGTRPRIDEGELGIVAVNAPSGGSRAWLEWSAASFDVESGGAIPAGIDGEAATLDSPLRFRIRPGALRVRIARAHPGASPSAVEPEGLWQALHALARIAAGR